MSSPDKILTCYGCGGVKPLIEFRYKCCYEHNNGVCKECIETKREVNIPDDHLLTKLHDLTEEYKAWLKIINDALPLPWQCWMAVGDNQRTYSYFDEQNQRHSITVNNFTGRYCTCCKSTKPVVMC